MPADLSVTANTIATSAFLPVVMNCFTPFSTQCVAVAVGARGDRAGVRADVRLREAEAAEALAARERLQILLLLRVGAERVERPADHRVLHADDRRCRAVARGDLLQRDGERHVVHAGAAEPLGHDHPERPERAERMQRFARKAVLAVPVRRMGRELRLREGPDRVAHEALLLGQQHRVTRPSRAILPHETRGQRCRRPGERAAARASPPRTEREPPAHAGGGEARTANRRRRRSRAASRRATGSAPARCRSRRRHELGKERELEQRDLRIEDRGQQSLPEELRGRKLGRRGIRRSVVAGPPRRHGEPREVGRAEPAHRPRRRAAPRRAAPTTRMRRRARGARSPTTSRRARRSPPPAPAPACARRDRRCSAPASRRARRRRGRTGARCRAAARSVSARALRQLDRHRGRFAAADAEARHAALPAVLAQARRAA